jgi:hypothetical protein
VHRRAFLSTVAVGAVSMAGCLGRAVGDDGSRDGGGSDAADGDGGESGTVDERGSEGTLPADPVRCRSDPVTVEHAVTDGPEYDDGREYFPSNETVRFVSSRGPDGPSSFGTVAFEEWASVEALDAAQERVVAATSDRLDTEAFASSIGRPPESAATDAMAVWVELSTAIEDGEVVETPTVGLSTLADAAPRAADVTVSIDGATHTTTAPVFARHTAGGPL